ncbi:MAG: ATP-binding protein [Acidimicrobiia bacterium]
MRTNHALEILTVCLAAVGLLAVVFGAPGPVTILVNAATIATAFGAIMARNEGPEQTDLIAEVSHELRTPLTGILGTLELLTDPTMPLEPSEVDELLVGAHSDANHLLHVVNNLHARSRLDRAILSPEAVPTNLFTLVGKAIARSPKVAPRCYISGGHQAMAVGDPQLIMQIATNLVQNIERYAPDGDVRINVSRSGDDTLAVFTDSGPGVPAHRAERIFDLSASAEGLGLGLSLSRQLARAMGGDLTCDNAGSKGAVFTLRLPACDDVVVEDEMVDFLADERYQAHSPRARLLVDLAGALNSDSLGHVVNGIAKIYSELLGATGAVLFVPRRDGSFRSAYYNDERSEVPAGEARDVEQVLRSGNTLLVEDVTSTGWGSTDNLGGKAALLLPVHDGNRVVAVLAVTWKRVEMIPTGAPVSVAGALAELTSSAIARNGLTRDIVFERRLRSSVLNELPIAVSVFAGDPPQLIDWNSKESELLGMGDDKTRPGDLDASQQLFDVRFADGTPLDLENAPVTNAIRTGQATGPFILRITRTDGSRVHTRTYCAPFFDADGHVAGAVVTSEPLDLGTTRRPASAPAFPR